MTIAKAIAVSSGLLAGGALIVFDHAVWGGTIVVIAILQWLDA